MKTRAVWLLAIIIVLFVECKNDTSMKENNSTKILFLHHSIGKNILRGNHNKIWYKITKRGDVKRLFQKYNALHNTQYEFYAQNFPKKKPYGWKNYPYDYYNIWVKHAGDSLFQEEPTLEILTKTYDIIIWKHCFPVSSIIENDGHPNVNSKIKTLENYKLQYNALKKKMHEFSTTKFIVWTPPALVKNATTEDIANRANLFSDWMIKEWDEKNDNIFIWDFRELETDGDFFIKPEYANSINDPHPNKKFAAKISSLFVNRIIDIIENNGNKTTLTGG
ncbi:hypothetical protein [uncultured Draconibacterium sp.]|uniref:hypothetical protein n=1 Tax=uncultured Draconibacterium sp. TaxID=1573823 RepID=UPI0029C705C3|nr:hypothetical protein [uncultured Draconibacterium sp.]